LRSLRFADTETRDRCFELIQALQQRQEVQSVPSVNDYALDLRVHADDVLKSIDWTALNKISKRVTLRKVTCLYASVYLRVPHFLFVFLFFFYQKGDTMSPNNGFLYIYRGQIRMTFASHNTLSAARLSLLLYEGEFFGDHTLFLSPLEMQRANIEFVVESDSATLDIFPHSAVQQTFENEPIIALRLIKTFGLHHTCRLLMTQTSSQQQQYNNNNNNKET
jgi:hypothetical protein